ncbi:MAG: hypothetical protein ACPH4D_06035 [Porticoccaceae bacterium]
MKQTSINLLGLFSAFALTCLATSYCAASTVEITYENSGTSVNNAGLHKLTLDGVSTFAMNAKSKTIRPGRTWTATVNSYDDIQAGAGKFNKRASDVKKYSQVGWLFSYMNFSESLSSSSESWNKAISEAVWKIMGKKGKLSSLATYVYNYATRGYSSIDNYNWSNSMTVYTSTNLKSEFFAPLAPIATPIPSAIFLFGSVFLGLFGLVRRSNQGSEMQA